MRAYGVQPNEITYCCIISAASKGYAGDIAVSILREMSNAGVPPNPLCYACAITACARCKNWGMVEKLFDEMEALDIPIQESIVISVINCCRSSVRPPKHIMNGDDMGDYTKNEWAKAIWIVNRLAGKTDKLTESLYTIAMDVCQEANRYREIVKLYFSMGKRLQGPTKSSLSFAFRACEKLKDADLALELFQSAIERGVCTNAMSGSVMVFCISMGRLDIALRAYQEVYAEDLADESRFMPITNTRRLIKDSLDYFSTEIIGPPRTMIGTMAEAKFYQGIVNIVLSTFRGNKMVLEIEDYERFLKTVTMRHDVETTKTLLMRSVQTPISKNFLSIYELAVNALFSDLPMTVAITFILELAAELHSTSKSRIANQLVVFSMSYSFNNISSVLDSGAEEETNGTRRRRAPNTFKQRSIYKLYSQARTLNGAQKDLLPIRMYRIAALACREGDLEDEMLELFQHTKVDNVVDRAVLSQAIYVLSKSRTHWAVGLEIFELLRSLREAPDSYMYTSALVACENGRDWTMALRYSIRETTS
jgi:pentatricopeptide repeat protein